METPTHVESVALKRRIELYLRALWDQPFHVEMVSTSEPTPYLEPLSNTVYLPLTIPPDQYMRDYYLAAASHLAAHSVFAMGPYEVGELNLLQKSMVGLIEDLRVEVLATHRYPGLKERWLTFHRSIDEVEYSARNLMSRLSRSILDPGYVDASQWVQKGKRLFFKQLSRLGQQDFAYQLGLALANDLGQMRLPLNSGQYQQAISYRDDNRHLWYENIEHEQQSESVTQTEKASLDNKRLHETDQGKRIDLVEGDFSAGTGLYIQKKDEAALDYRNNRMAEATSSRFYPEWDYRSGVLKENWCRLVISQAKKGDAQQLEILLSAHKFTLNRLKALAKKLQVEKLQTVRKVQEGDDIDHGPMIDAMVALRMGVVPEPRVFMRNEYRHTKSLAISILLDLSESTNQYINGVSVIQTIRDAVLLLGETLTVADEQFSISGFSSNTRHAIHYIQYKHFNEPFSSTRDRLMNIKGQYSTRLGAAMRHAAEDLSQQNASKKLLLVITDGAPSDVDVFDSQYLDHDSHQAVSSLYAKGIKPFCINLDSSSDNVTAHIFGKGRYETIEHINKLPDVLSRIYVKYGRH